VYRKFARKKNVVNLLDFPVGRYEEKKEKKKEKQERRKGRQERRKEGRKSGLVKSTPLHSTLLYSIVG
jgi:hypothetical protein